MTWFSDRCHIHDKWLKRVDAYERSIGLRVDGTRAVENSIGDETHKALLLLPNNQIAKMLRWFPDRLIVSSHFIALQELKTRQKDNTGSFAMEIDSYDAGLWLHNRGKRVFIVLCPSDELAPVVGLKTAWINDIKFCTGILTQHRSGSGTPYRLINEELETLQPLSQFINKEFFRAQPTQREL